MILTFTYTNWKNETAFRRVQARALAYKATSWHPEKQWILTAYDLDRESERDFALRDACDISWAPEDPEETTDSPPTWLLMETSLSGKLTSIMADLHIENAKLQQLLVELKAAR